MVAVPGACDVAVPGPGAGAAALAGRLGAAGVACATLLMLLLDAPVGAGPVWLLLLALLLVEDAPAR